LETVGNQIYYREQPSLQLMRMRIDSQSCR
jgi:hypothetical protein